MNYGSEHLQILKTAAMLVFVSSVRIKVKRSEVEVEVQKQHSATFSLCQLWHHTTHSL
jgi:hypothetical protein